MTTDLPLRARVALAMVAAYIRRVPWPRGKGFLIRRILRPSLPPLPAEFAVRRPGGTKVYLYYREQIGISALLHGGFEDAECRTLCEHAKPGTTAIDVGAHVGMIAIPLAQRLGSAGLAVAIEPLRENIERLEANARRNALSNIKIVERAAASHIGTVRLTVASDPAFGSTGTARRFATTTAREVPTVSLDGLWDEIGRREVSVVKVDVEGSEADVLRSGLELLRAQRPVVMAEAPDEESLRAIWAALDGLGYERRHYPSFRPWNHLFLPSSR